MPTPPTFLPVCPLAQARATCKAMKPILTWLDNFA